MKIVVCKGCGNSFSSRKPDGTPGCVVCAGISVDNSIPIEIGISDIARCCHCSEIATYDLETKLWTIGNTKPRGREGYRNSKHQKLPFHDKTGRFYCGCMGWD